MYFKKGLKNLLLWSALLLVGIGFYALAIVASAPILGLTATVLTITGIIQTVYYAGVVVKERIENKIATYRYYKRYKPRLTKTQLNTKINTAEKSNAQYSASEYIPSSKYEHKPPLSQHTSKKTEQKKFISQNIDLEK